VSSGSLSRGGSGSMPLPRHNRSARSPFLQAADSPSSPSKDLTKKNAASAPDSVEGAKQERTASQTDGNHGDRAVASSSWGSIVINPDSDLVSSHQVRQLTRIYTITNCCLLSATFCTWILTTSTRSGVI
jgi:hypothetical protein